MLKFCLEFLWLMIEKQLHFYTLKTIKLKTTIWLMSNISKNQTVNVIARLILEFNWEFFISQEWNNLLKRRNKCNGGGVWYKEERVSEHI